jgi:hypothetical protein
MNTTETTETTVAIGTDTYRVILAEDQATILTGPAVLDRIAEVVTARHEQVAEMHSDVEPLTVAQVMAGVMCELAATQAQDGFYVCDTHAADDEVGDLPHLAAYVEKIMSEGWIVDRMRSTYTRRGSTR